MTGWARDFLANLSFVYLVGENSRLKDIINLHKANLKHHNITFICIYDMTVI